MKEIGVYIHIPFCKSKCYYCDFNSFPEKFNLVEKYVYYIKKEIDIYAKEYPNCIIKTVFIGGGTPSAIEARYIEEIINYLFKKFKTEEKIEISIECNPKTLTREKLRTYRNIGINRISIGLQSLNDNLLRKIGRIHTSGDFFNSLKLIKEEGFENINVDIMFNLPSQTLEDVINTLKRVITLDIKHISFYSLKIEKGTPFYKLYNQSKLKLPSEDLERRMYYKGKEILEKNGFKHYEISNFAKEDFKCRHNIIYWKVKPYLGIGLSAHSNLSKKRWRNVASFESYFKYLEKDKKPIIELEKIDSQTEISEFMILGLRLVDGINKAEFRERFKIDIHNIYNKQLIKLKDLGLIREDKENIKLTKKGLDLANIVFMEFI
ncbi:radical SAM family heme chaperone HemW [Thermohalobacter berrensis]|uniref:Heme chaperone HemW n=1 Tax=Thermohalobacter berrensis TaxID=99594 RepID=A0A419TB86_9FIRM|nr:radical SAM family heme chaperone HemW [Thermohalobacter berrensis]RKD34749.1 coproporphyrinogen III oxidase [Thermohalobacter berrensis]